MSAETNNGTSKLNDAELQGIIAEINKPFDGFLPTPAIRAAQANRERITPLLIELLQQTTKQVRAGEPYESDGANIALYLLTEFQATAALPAVIDALTLPEDSLDIVFGDSLTEFMDTALARLAPGQIAPIATLVNNTALNEYVRWKAADVYKHFVLEGSLTRSQAVEYLREHLLAAIQKEDRVGASGIVSALSEMYPLEATAEIQEAFHQGLVDEQVIDEAFINQMQDRGEAEFHKNQAHLKEFYFTDTVETLSRWYCYSPESRQKQAKVESASRELPSFLLSDRGEEPSWRLDPPMQTTAPYLQERVKVGRNDPCPCGSGKKFKKCCASRVEL
jgi:hypothetical protein